MKNQQTDDIEKLELNEPFNEEEILNNRYGLSLIKSNKEVKPKSITLKLILDRNLNIDSRENLKNEYKNKFEFSRTNEDDNDENNLNKEKNLDKAELKAKQLLKLTHIHLDREQIIEIDNLNEYLGDVTHLFLQNNLIKRIENLEFLHKLKFLVLSSNQIRHIENLLDLKQLKLLDLSYNLIDEFQVTQLPKSLVFLDLRENECLIGSNQTWFKQDYRNKLMNYLHELKQLNGEDLIDKSEEEESEEDNETINDNKKKKSYTQNDSFKMLSERIIERSRQRQLDDVVNLNELSKQRKLKIEEERRSIDKNLKST